MPFMTTEELLQQHRFTRADIINLTRLMPSMAVEIQERAARTLANLRGQLGRIEADIAIAAAQRAQ